VKIISAVLKEGWADRKAKTKGAFLQLFTDIAPKTLLGLEILSSKSYFKE
jgi:hypothetical protein